MNTYTGLVVLVLALVQPLSLAAQEDPAAEPAEPTWSGNLGLSYVSTSGNTDTAAGGLDFTLVRTPDPWGVDIAAKLNRAEEEGVTTAERLIASARARRSFGDIFGAFAGVSGERDQFAGYDLLAIVEAGGSWNALRGPKHLLSLDAGLTFTDEDRIEGEMDVDYLGGILGAAYEWKLSQTASFFQKLRYWPNFDDSENWRLGSETALQAAVNSWLALKLGYEIRYRNQPIEEEDTDTTTNVSVVMKF